MKFGYQVGHALAQSVISRHLTPEARCRYVVDKLALG
jgi:hypothetical protein